MSNILIAVSSSVAIYKTCDLIRMFKKSEHDVKVIMTENSTKLISPILFETLTENRVHRSVFDEMSNMAHISLKDFADAYLICPATANIIAKCANGIADDIVSTTFLSVKCPVVIAPAMNPAMWQNDATQENIEKLKNRGCRIIMPEKGKVVCGDEGVGKLPDLKVIYDETISVTK